MKQNKQPPVDKSKQSQWKPAKSFDDLMRAVVLVKPEKKKKTAKRKTPSG